MMTNPARLGWVGLRLVESPARHLAVGDRLVFGPVPGLRLSWNVLAVEPLRTLELDSTTVAAQGRHHDDLVVPDAERRS